MKTHSSLPTLSAWATSTQVLMTTLPTILLGLCQRQVRESSVKCRNSPRDSVRSIVSSHELIGLPALPFVLDFPVVVPINTYATEYLSSIQRAPRYGACSSPQRPGFYSSPGSIRKSSVGHFTVAMQKQSILNVLLQLLRVRRDKEADLAPDCLFPSARRPFLQ